MLSQASIVLLGFIASSMAVVPAPTPEPTTGPNAHELLKRQSRSGSGSESSSESSSSSSFSPTRTLLAGPDATCGYLGGQSDRSYGCDTGTCFLATTTPILVTISLDGAISTATVAGLPTPGSILCCDPSTGCPSVPAPTACVDINNFPSATASSASGSQASASSGSITSSSSVSSDSMTLTCTSGLYIFCNTLTFVDPFISAHFCNYISNTQIQNATTTYSGQVGHDFTLTQPVFAQTYTPPPPSTPSASASATAASASPTATASPKKKSDKGTIIGGVVGGVLGALLIAGAVILFIRRRNSGVVEEEDPKTETPASELVQPVQPPVEAAAAAPVPSQRTTRIVDRRR